MGMGISGNLTVERKGAAGGGDLAFFLVTEATLLVVISAEENDPFLTSICCWCWCFGVGLLLLLRNYDTRIVFSPPAPSLDLVFWILAAA